MGLNVGHGFQLYFLLQVCVAGVEFSGIGRQERAKAEALAYLDAMARTTVRQSWGGSVYIPTHRDEIAMDGAPDQLRLSLGNRQRQRQEQRQQQIPTG